jgi:hypothetical protein
MLGLDFVLVVAPETHPKLAHVVGGTVTQTEQTVKSSASSFFYGNGATKFRKSENLCSARWAALLTIQHRLRRGFDRKKRSQTPDACDMSAIQAGGQTCPDYCGY